MNKRKKYFLFLLLIVPFAAFSQGENEELIKWSPTRKLTWADYKAAPDASSDAAASTTTYLGISYDISSRGFSYKIESSFSKTRSWGLHKTEYILAHEQGHFDIAEIFARKLHKKMSAYTFNKNTYQRVLKKIYQDILDEKERLQNDYDKETNHSINKEKQEEWLKKISGLLEDLREYAGY
jgi:hypothetical protein